MALQQDASGSSTYASILSKVPSYFIGEEIEVQGGNVFYNAQHGIGRSENPDSLRGAGETWV